MPVEMHCRVPAARACSVVRCAMFALALALFASSAAAQLPRLAVSADGRTLVKGSRPFFWQADTAWRLYRLTPDEQHAYFANRRSKGFNVIQGPVLHTSTPNVHGETNTDHATPNEAWFAYIDQTIDRAAAHGLYVVPVLTWYTFASEFTIASAFEYGRYVGQRYRDRTNIAAMIICGEFNHPTANVKLWAAMAEGVRDGFGSTPVLLTALPRWYGVSGGQSSSYDLHGQTWLSFNMHQSSLYGDCSNDPSNLYYMGTHNWLLAEHDWPLTPTKPFLDAEPSYEDAAVTNGLCDFNPTRWPAFGVRRRAYWSVFAGAFGHSYGANGVVQFYMPGDGNVWGAPAHFWPDAIEFEAAGQMQHLRRLVQSRPMPGRIPGQDLLLAGATEDVPHHPHATRDALGAYAMVYVPQTSKTITIDMGLLSGTAHRAWWFEPGSGVATLIGEFTAADYSPEGGFTQTTPASGEDWVLVVDDVDGGFPAPGEAPLWTPGDATGDDLVNVDDLIAVILGWGPCPASPQPCPADVQASGTVDVDDLILVILSWGGQ